MRDNSEAMRTDREPSASVILAVSEEQASKVTGLSVSQLRAWDARGFFTPDKKYDVRGARNKRIYSFKDLVGLKTLYELRMRHKIGFKRLADVERKLKGYGIDHWADTRLYVLKKQVYFENPQTSEVVGVEDGQVAMLEIVRVIENVKDGIESIRRRESVNYGQTQKKKFQMRNAEVISGTRIPVATVERYLEAGKSRDEILADYPTLTDSDIDMVREGLRRAS